MKKSSLAAFLFLISSVCCNASEKEANSFAEDLPLIFWYTLELWSKEPRGTTDSGFSSSEYISFTKAEVTELKKTYKNSETWVFNMFFTDVEDHQGWNFVFTLKDQKWEAVSGYRIMKGDNLDLYQGDLFSKSMKPHMKKSLAAYNSGTLNASVKKIQE